jgi:hypothetical protein
LEYSKKKVEMKVKANFLVKVKILDKKRTLRTPEKGLQFDLKAYRILF